MNSKLPSRLLIMLVLLIPVSCGRILLPAVPSFEELGFTNAHEPVRRQVLAAYEHWQESPRDASRNGRLGMLFSAYGKNIASEILYRRARILAPREFRWTYYLAIALHQLGRYQEAAGMYREALKIDPDYVEARLQLAALLLQGNESEESAGLYQQFTAEFPGRVEGWLGLGKALDRNGDLAAAIEALQRARIVGPQYGAVHYALAAVLAAGGDEEGAALEFAAYERTAKNSIYTTDALMLEIIRLNLGEEPYMARADRQLQRGQIDEAVASFRAALAINPVSQDAWGGLVSAQAQLGDMDEAGHSYRAALAAGISYARLHLTYGQALLDHKQPDAARDIIGKAIELDPQYAEAHLALGELEMQSGASSVAAAQFRRALTARPNDRRVMLLLAQALNATGEFQEAAARLQSLRSDPAVDSSSVLKELALAYHGMDRSDEAIDALRLGRDAAEKSANTAMVDAIDSLLNEWQSEPVE
ncbi:MAG: tetratricopeptide repeat protein [Gammaproteobacteria bacterium]|nr:tetratricopeptide repeat protein [Gammaproteobacteria bacterium]